MRALASCLLLLASACHAAPTDGLTETLHVVNLPRGADLPVLASVRTGTTPSIAVLLFPGYPGVLHLREEGGVIAYDLKGAAMPQLFVHHRDDPCELTRYASIVRVKGELPLVTVSGSVDPRGAACEAFTEHGFVGRERATMRAIAAWVTRRAVADAGADAGTG